MSAPRLLITMGEPAGIGPDLCLALGEHHLPGTPVVIGSRACLQRRAAELGVGLRLRPWEPEQPWPEAEARSLAVLDLPLPHPCRAGQLEPGNAEAVLRGLDLSVEILSLGLADALVTGPMHKGVINDAGIPFAGHTEYLARLCGVEQVVMMLVGRGLRVALATTHLPLRAVADAIQMESLETTLRILHQALRTDFGLADPRILVAGLNPHAGEGGHLGREELDVIVPVLHALQGEGMRLHGPLPADTLFQPRTLEEADAVLAMYHDQGLPVLKYHAFGAAVNITLGLPIVRTSVDHGTALDLAGTGQAEVSSLLAALNMAAEIHHNRRG
ncbi:MAG: 4-hydroxythreonine-4-phosphate dehydrogenase PdxA [Acidithiobacillus sp.]|uniref:4-hydroxythreonine-4-phosphate dehydrogenase PdxA n=1 Tax=Acidithiobacillus sp. TaxID=1872118 RepID=UPI003D04AE63